jgi:phosphatidate cytidylyltransferase
MRQRVATAAILVLVLLIILGLSSIWPLAAFGVLIVIASAVEVRRLTGLQGFPFPVLAALAWAAWLFVPWGDEAALLTLSVASLLGMFGVWAAKGRLAFEAGMLWVTAPILGILVTKEFFTVTSWSLARPVLLLLVPVWAGDTAAIFAGKAWGKHPLAPNISPKKTWEGSIANLVFAIAAAGLLAHPLHVAMSAALLTGFSGGILGQFGDLFESALKRKMGLKDSGNLLPGHGGVLDRIDSLLASAIASALILWYLR